MRLFKPHFFLCILALGQSQHGEDSYVMRHYLSNVKNGTFAELGALDGMHKSNTLKLD